MKCLLFVKPENFLSYFGFGSKNTNRTGTWNGSNLYYISFDGRYMTTHYSKFKLSRISKWRDK